MDVKVGLLLPYGDPSITSPSFLREFAGVAETAGAESVWAVEPVVVAEAYEPRYPYSPDGRMPSRGAVVPLPDPLELLTFVAATTRRLRLGTAVVVAPLHSPVVLAKRAATLALLSERRFELGLGIGWQIEEYAAVGVPYARRGERLEDAILAMRALWSAAPATFVGPFTSFERVHLEPRPPGGHVPVVVGGNSPPAIERAGRLADGWFPYTISPAEFTDGVAHLRSAAIAAGRAADAVEVTVWPGSFDATRNDDVTLGRTYVDAGASRVILRPTLAGDDPFGALAGQIAAYREGMVA